MTIALIITLILAAGIGALLGLVELAQRYPRPTVGQHRPEVAYGSTGQLGGDTMRIDIAALARLINDDDGGDR